jgi:translation elongation factor EF-Tu-like GTPase
MGIFDIFSKKTDSLGNSSNNEIDYSEKYTEDIYSNINPENSSFKLVVDGFLMKSERGIVISGKVEIGEVNPGDYENSSILSNEVLSFLSDKSVHFGTSKSAPIVLYY